tara:strand:+ start:1089 stop:1769 length:681 start_codon:yes stop_codon:yes gene_type:complete
MITARISRLLNLRKGSKLLSKKELRYVRDAKALALAGLQIVNNNEVKLAKLLNINLELLDNILKERAILTRPQIDKIRKNFAKRIALYDTLSSLENTMNLRATLHNLSEISTISLLFITFNNSKEIYDKYDYETLDEILQQASSRVSKDYPCAYMTRLADDKFCLIFANKNKYQAKQLAQELKELLEREYDLVLTGIKFNPNLKITAVNFPEDVKTIAEVIKMTKR